MDDPGAALRVSLAGTKPGSGELRMTSFGGKSAVIEHCCGTPGPGLVPAGKTWFRSAVNGRSCAALRDQVWSRLKPFDHARLGAPKEVVHRLFTICQLAPNGPGATSIPPSTSAAERARKFFSRGKMEWTSLVRSPSLKRSR